MRVKPFQATVITLREFTFVDPPPGPSRHTQQFSVGGLPEMTKHRESLQVRDG
jgi:hypothetical protein